MPLVKSASKKARSKNIATEIDAGKPVRQAVAIGYSVQRRSEGKEMRRKHLNRWARGKEKLESPE